jgi:hypothetical protein
MTQINAISLSLACSSTEEIQKVTSTLAEGGLLTRPLHEFLAEQSELLPANLACIGCFTTIKMAFSPKGKFTYLVSGEHRNASLGKAAQHRAKG